MAWELWALEEEHARISTSPFRICSTTSWPRAGLHSNCIGVLKQEASGVQRPVSKPLSLGRLGFEISLCPTSLFKVCLSFPSLGKGGAGLHATGPDFFLPFEGAVKTPQQSKQKRGSEAAGAGALVSGRRDVRTARRFSGRTCSQRICPGLLGSLLRKSLVVKWVEHGPG